MALLPQELFDAIIDEIHDKETLKACALVGSSFLPPSRRKLFRKVQLGGRGQHSRDTSADLAEFPHLVSYIRDLILVMPSTVPNSVAVAGVLRSVQNIESLVVFGIQWNRLEHEVCSALLDCLSRPSLQRLDLYHMEGVPTALISAATAIPVACFYYVHMDMHEEISEQLHASAPTPRLRHLILGGPGHVVLPVCNFLLHPRKPASTQQIERLEIRLSQDSASYAERIMAACAATLKGLVFHPTDLIRLPLLPFVLEVEIKVSVSDNRRLPAFLSHNFSQIASSLPLAETITLVPHPTPSSSAGSLYTLPAKYLH